MSTTAIKSGLLVWLLTILLACLTVISACSSSSGDKAPGAIPTAPTNLTFTVHSHEAELFWTASTDDGLVIGYDIIRDGVPVKELVDTTNFLDDTLDRTFCSDDDRHAALSEFQARCARRFHNFYPPVSPGEPVPAQNHEIGDPAK